MLASIAAALALLSPAPSYATRHTRYHFRPYGEYRTFHCKTGSCYSHHSNGTWRHRLTPRQGL